MLKFIHILFFLLSCLSIKAQQTANVYALIIGISDYEDSSIKDLKYAHRDAELFADYLQSDSGGNVPSENIKLLTNEDASIANIYLEKAWLEKKAREGGTAYFYFSGHGDVESSLYELGFLLAADTPNKNYLNNAVRIEDINNMANTLSVLEDVNVVLITDACHAGKLSGSDNRGQQLVGEQLSKAQSKEVRIASCESSQLSQEGKEWGGGRGAFSYYLINGLKGLADDEAADGRITLLELKKYLDVQVPSSVKLKKLKKQTPVIKGNDHTEMAFVNMEALNNLETDIGDHSVERILTPLNRYFRNLKNENIKDYVDFSTWTSFTKDQIIDSVLTIFPYISDSLLVESDWYQEVRTDTFLRNQFASQFGAFLHDVAQKAINGYLTGDKKELERRQYYNILEQNFDKYPSLLQVAGNLTDKENYLYQIIEMKKHYFKGLDNRLDAVIKSNNSDSLMQKALEAQKRAHNLNPKAAFVLNEIGNINRYFEQIDTAIHYFNRAAELIPSWAVPRSNLSSIYYKIGQYDMGLKYGVEATQVQDDYYMGFINLGLNAQNLNDLLLAEECFRKATVLDDRHYRAFETLGYLYNIITNYALSEHFFLEAEARKNPLLIASEDSDGIIDMLDTEILMPNTDVLDTSHFGKKDIMAMLVYAQDAILKKDLLTAERYLKKIVRIDNTNPLVFRYLAEIYYLREDWAMALDYFSNAKVNFLEEESFELHYQELLPSQKYTAFEIPKQYKWAYFKKDDLHYRLGEVAKQLGYTHLTSREYEEWIDMDSSYIAPYLKLMELYEDEAKYHHAESTINRIKVFDTQQAKYETYGFYKRMIDRDFKSVEYHYKAGFMMYEIIQSDGAISQLEYHSFQKDFLAPTTFMPSKTKAIFSVVEYTLEMEFTSPILLAIEHFEAIEAELETKQRADICNILGELFDYYGDDTTSKHYYQIAMELNPKNESYKLEYFQKLNQTFELTKALAVLDSLNRNRSILYEQMLTYATYLARTSRYSESFEIYERLKKIQINQDSMILSNKVIVHLLANNSKEAIDQYKYLDKTYPKNPETSYSLARLYAVDGKKNKAFKYLERAIELGFDYRYVINTDSFFSELKNSTKWDKMINKHGLQI